MSEPYETWNCAVHSFVFKAQQNLIYANEAKKNARFDIEANRVYYALHQLVCELVRIGKMSVQNPGRRATTAEPWRIEHGSYAQEIRNTLGNACCDADLVISTWQQFRMRGDYDPQQIQATSQWKSSIVKRRQDAIRVAEAIYAKIIT